MKKLIAVILMLALCMSISGCGAAKEKKAYQEAGVLMENKDWEGALALYESIPEYNDALDKVLECRYQLAMRAYDAKAYEKAAGIFDALGDYKDAADYAEKSNLQVGMMENADYTFLRELEERTTRRLDTGMPEWGSFNFFVEEIEAFKKYETETFYNPRIAELYKSYMGGLELHKSSLAAANYQTAQERNMEGVRLQYIALTEFYKDYGFMNERPTYKKYYYDYQVQFLTAYDGYVAIKEDIETQFKTLLETKEIYALQEATEAAGECSITLTNNTQHTYSGIVVFNLRDVRGAHIANGDFMLFGPLEPGASHEFTVPLDEPDKLWDFVYNIIIADVDGYTVG